VLDAPGRGGIVELPREITVGELAERLKVGAVEVIKALLKSGIMATMNQLIEYDAAAAVAEDLGFEPIEADVPVDQKSAAGARAAYEDAPQDLQPRPPVITIMGHVDHGKTSLLDAIRQANVTAGESGGITQHIGAYQAEVNGQKITFLDTPGHEAFTQMRARGAQVTDIAVLVVAADDGVMPQTIEAIDHAKAAGVPIVVAINKVDKDNADPDRVKQELTNYDLVWEQYGGDTVMVPVSARTKAGLDDLLENLLLVAELQELKANPNRPAQGVVVEARVDKNRGPVATVLVQTGTLRPADTVVVGDTWGKIKAMFDDKGRRMKEAGPAVPSEILGLNGVPAPGDRLAVVQDEKVAKTIVTERERSKQLGGATGHSVSLDDVFTQIQSGEVKELNLILKTDVQGSIDPIRASIEKLDTGGTRVKVIHTGAGSITESDVMLATASKAIIIGFNSRPEPGARRMAEAEGVDIRYYDVIYEILEDVRKAATGMLEPKMVEVIDGHAEVRQVFQVSRRAAIAGSYILDGRVTRNSEARVFRGKELLYAGKVATLKRFKDDAREVLAGFECGITLDGFDAFEEGDRLEFFHKESQKA
jgi:translation initiation factor IF-2